MNSGKVNETCPHAKFTDSVISSQQREKRGEKEREREREREEDFVHVTP